MFPNCYSSVNSLMSTEWCQGLEVAKNRCPSFCFSRSSVKFQGHRGKKMSILTRIDCNSCLNEPMAMKWCTSLTWQEEVPYKVICQISSSLGTKHAVALVLFSCYVLGFILTIFNHQRWCLSKNFHIQKENSPCTRLLCSGTCWSCPWEISEDIIRAICGKWEDTSLPSSWPPIKLRRTISMG